MGLKVNKTQLAQILGKSQTTLTTYQKNGLPICSDGKRGTKNIYDTADVIQWLVEFSTAKIVPGNNGDPSITMYNLDQQRARKEKEAADKLEMQNAQQRKELFPSWVLQNALENIINQIGAVLDSIPINIKRKVPELTASDIEIIKTEIAKARNLAAESRLEV